MNYSFTGIIRFSYVVQFHLIKLKIEFYKILSNDNNLINSVYKSCIEDPVSPNALKLVSTDLVYSKLLTYNEALLLRNYLQFVTLRNISMDCKSNQMWQIEFAFPNDINHFKVVLSSSDVFNIYSQVNAYCSNYLVNDLVMKFIANSNKLSVNDNVSCVSKDSEKKVTECIPVVSIQKTDDDSNVISNNVTNNDDKVDDKTDDEFEEIFSLCLTSAIKSSMIYYTLSYFKNFDDSRYCKLLMNDKKQVKVIAPMPIPGNFVLDEEYFLSLILSSNLCINNLTYIIRKIFSMFIDSYDEYKTRPLFIMMLLYLAFIYLLRYLYEVNKNSFRENFSKIIISAVLQKSLFSSLISNTFTEFNNKLFFEFLAVNNNQENSYQDFSLNNSFTNNNDSILIQKISNEFKHLIPISQEEFADKVFSSLFDNNDNDNDEKGNNGSNINNNNNNNNNNNINNSNNNNKNNNKNSNNTDNGKIIISSSKQGRKLSKLPIDFKLSSKKVIDISKYISSSSSSDDNKKSLSSILPNLFDPDNILSPIKDLSNLELGRYLNYKIYPSNNGDKIISAPYYYLINYLKNPSSILLIKDKKIPKEVINLYDILSKSVLTRDKIRKDDISTLYYYNVLIDSLPDPTVFRHSLFLYVIFQIIIPYHYDVYGNTQFLDVFL